MQPIELLENELSELISARNHSIISMERKEIDVDLHERHMKNLAPMIENYKFAINILKQYV